MELLVPKLTNVDAGVQDFCLLDVTFNLECVHETALITKNLDGSFFFKSFQKKKAAE